MEKAKQLSIDDIDNKEKSQQRIDDMTRVRFVVEDNGAKTKINVEDMYQNMLINSSLLLSLSLAKSNSDAFVDVTEVQEIIENRKIDLIEKQLKFKIDTTQISAIERNVGSLCRRIDRVLSDEKNKKIEAVDEASFYMDSEQLASLINMYRDILKVTSKKVSNSSIVKKIEKEIAELAYAGIVYTDAKEEIREGKKCYRLNREATCQLLSKEAPEVRIEVLKIADFVGEDIDEDVDDDYDEPEEILAAMPPAEEKIVGIVTQQPFDIVAVAGVVSEDANVSENKKKDIDYDLLNSLYAYSNTSYNLTDACGMINNILEGKGSLGVVKFTALLRGMKMLKMDNKPSAAAANLFYLKKVKIDTAKGSKTQLQTMVREKGVIKIAEKIRKLSSDQIYELIKEGEN